ncbi:hypothetical protein GPECTOR_144g725 [Gonium pectorale]|uniref:Uncharacterized protein n=1 Tax=Gonium pectorale TaxID=33097 RepID=A0A150FXW8_GONPE|nr:hypothetical protein GPECTOR_144g725 [Gonium pectorale]|eukprot:KXZ42462.1 hypothetical protein GPECTOR_144g725 [Gonium pectorale]
MADSTLPPVYPSTRRYKERLSLAEEDTYKYNKLYASTQGSTVWSRLTADATVRQSSARANGTFQEGGAQVRHSVKNSGFESNTCPAPYTSTTFKSGLLPASGLPVEELHKIQAVRYKQKYPLDFMSEIRPETETTNQAMRMLGTYAADQSHADRLGVFIPQGCPGGKPSYHPDVMAGGFGLAPTLPRRGLGQTLVDGRNLK